MQRGKSVKIKEVIESLCKLLSELGVDSVPGTDTFRRAKFNKGDAVEDLWRLLYSLLSKAVRWECACQTTQEHDVDARARLVCGVLWRFGSRGPLAGAGADAGRGRSGGGGGEPRPPAGPGVGPLLREPAGEPAGRTGRGDPDHAAGEVGLSLRACLVGDVLRPRRALPAAPDGWRAAPAYRCCPVDQNSCRRVTPFPLTRKQPASLSDTMGNYAPPGPQSPTVGPEWSLLLGLGEERAAWGGPDGAGAGPGPGEWEWEGGLRRLQWEQGKLRLLWRGLQAAQAERARLLHQVLSATSGPLDTHPATSCTGHNKELERLQTDIQVLEIYLEWKQMEPLFWCWMDSVIDTELAEPSPPSHRGAVAMALESAVVKGARCQGDGGRRGTDELSETLPMLQVQLKAWRAELAGHASPSENVIASSEKARIQERVKLRLRGLTEAYAAPRPTCRRYRLRPQEHPAHRPHRPTKHCPSQAGQPIEAQASRLIEELREEEAGLRQEVERLRRGQREELQELASRLEGVVLIPPLKR
ncbi:hypothetical protein ANANG_G00018420 [Anguilla anguilla]|uniref:Tubulin epsilon and delta complex protein 1 domain-containing protein n=1 Tax=Anguilla anguilla TaxID=7936 RepID=A0A9D3MYD3_ANGAN|nr:hypothetical protein ANANG_G00018420 [Anguilla anguilla]